MQSYLAALLCACALVGVANGDSVCYGNLGCFTDDYPWGGTEERPTKNLPNPPEEVNVRFYLDTRKALDVEVFNDDMNGLQQTTFNRNNPTKFIVHGFLQNGDTKWLEDMSDALRKVEDCNVFRVSWPGGSTTLQYPQSVADTQIVGAEIAVFINNMKYDLAMSSENFHCIGHSLGAQSCSYLGGKVSPKVDRITGLDPAGPYYQNTPNEVRLESTDAQYVDVIHTDAEKLVNFGFGINQVSGHIDFWPNNGIAQPGCDQNALSTILDQDGLWQGTQNFVACNHLRALDLFTESMTTTCPFVGNPCLSYDEFLAGKCNDCGSSGTCPQMGYWSFTYSGGISDPNYYLETRSLEPYCEYMTYVEVDLGSNSDGIQGRLYLTLYGTSSNTEQEQLSDEKQDLDLRPSTTYSYVAQYDTFPASFYKVKLLWTQEEFTVTNQYITVSQIRVWVDHEQTWYIFYGDISQDLSEGVRYTFYAS